MDRRDIYKAFTMLLVAAIAYGYLHREFYLDRMKVRGAEVYVGLSGEPSTLVLNGKEFGDGDLRLIKTVASINNVNLKNSAITDAGLRHLRSTSIHTLCLSDTAISDMGLKEVANLKNLHFLNLSGTAVTNTGIEYLMQLPKLRSLSLDGCEKIRPDELGILRSLANLDTLYLRGISVDPTVAQQVQSELVGITIHFGASDMVGLEPHSPLQAVWIRPALEIALIPNLDHQQIAGWTSKRSELPGDLLESLARPELVSTIILSSRTPANADVSQTLSRFPNLKFLKYYGVIDDAIVSNIAENRKLKTLVIDGSDPDGTRISKAAIIALAKCQQIESLVLRFPDIPFESFQELKALPQLKRFGAVATGATFDSLRWVEQFPKLQLLEFWESDIPLDKTYNFHQISLSEVWRTDSESDIDVQLSPELAAAQLRIYSSPFQFDHFRDFETLLEQESEYFADAHESQSSDAPARTIDRSREKRVSFEVDRLLHP